MGGARGVGRVRMWGVHMVWRQSRSCNQVGRRWQRGRAGDPCLCGRKHSVTKYGWVQRQSGSNEEGLFS
eukprot:351638-Chlamydomonas_euryale.AAC.8